MRSIVGLKGILGLLVLTLSLQAVCPATDYNSRLELFNPTAAPGDAQRRNPIPSKSWMNWTNVGVARSEVRTSLARPVFRKGQIVHAPIPIYQKALPAADDSRIVQDRYESGLYTSRSVSRASGRGPPKLTA